jgi:REP element-mobilizing transposase RayT
MARPLRIAFFGGLYPIISRGKAGENIYQDNEDGCVFFDLQSHSYERHAWACHAYSLMPSHYHLLLETTQRTLSKRMKHLNGKYTGQFNHCHGRERHGLRGRLKASTGSSYLIGPRYLLAGLTRYIA